MGDKQPPIKTLATVDREHIQRALDTTKGNKLEAAKLLGISRRALYRRLERLGMSDIITRRDDHETTTDSESEPTSTDS